MNIENIVIEEIPLKKKLGTPFEFKGIFSGKILAGIKLTLSNLATKDQRIIEDLTEKSLVCVKDPFVQRSYDAYISQKSNSFTVGEEVKSYVLELKEKDVLPQFSEIQLNGHIFKVHLYEEYITDGSIGRNAILKLNKDEFEILRNLLTEHTVKFQRIGIDNEPLELRLGGAMYWSSHNDDNEAYFKHIVRLFPVEQKPCKLNLASGITQSVAVAMLVELQAKFKLLIEALGKEKIISDEMQAALSGPEWRDLSDKKFIYSLHDEFTRTNDAEEQF